MNIQTEPFRKVVHPTAQEACKGLDLSPEGRALLLPGLSVQGFLALLADADAIGDAVRLLAFALPPREGVWWACTVAQEVLPAGDSLQAACLERATAWVYEPSEDNRYRCLDAAEAAGLAGAAAYAALGAFWSGGSMAPPGMPEALPDPRLSPIGSGASVLLSITAGPPKSLRARFEAALARGIDIANGGNGRPATLPK